MKINEIMGSNTSTIYDEDGDTPDWLEIYNGSNATINLDGYGIADDTIANERWLFPAIDIQPGEFITLWASGKDRKEIPLHWETEIDLEDTWTYLVPQEEPPAAWKDSTFDASTWTEGQSGFGYGDGDDRTEIQHGTLSIYLRKEFTIDDLDNIKEAIFHIDFDDAFVAYINGVEFARDNITSSGSPAFDQGADDYDHEARMYKGGQPNEYTVPMDENLLLQGRNIIAIQVHNFNSESSDLSAIPFLTFGKIESEGGSISSSLNLISTFGAHFHTDFKISSSGETIYLTTPEGDHLDSLNSGPTSPNLSYGRKPDGSSTLGFFDTPTPRSSNTTDIFEGFANSVVFSTPGGIYDASINLTLNTEDPSDIIYYTLDGHDPDITSLKYTAPIPISSTTTVRAAVLSPGHIKSNIMANTYLMGIDHGNLPVVSLSADHDMIWDENTGIYTFGPNAEGEFPHFNANFWQDWEIPATVQLIDPGNGDGFLQAGGIKIFGGWSRGHPQKSLAVHFRKSYGADRVKYQIFPDLELDEFSSFVLRNSGNDWNRAMFRDALITSLFHPNVEKQASRQAVVYLNGAYMGIHNIREKVNEDFLANHHDLDPDSISMLESDAQVIEGNEEHYRNMITYIENNDLSLAEHYDYISTQMEMTNYIQYMVGNIFASNNDWPGNNIKFWRPQTATGKWRWITFDTDFGFDLFNEGTVNQNTIAFATTSIGEWPTPDWSVFLFSNLLKNETFKRAFINEMADQINSNLDPENVNSKIDAFEDAIADEINNHLNRWGGSFSEHANAVARMRNFAYTRPARMLAILRQHFSLTAQRSVNIDIEDRSSGKVIINSLTLEDYPWRGDYFQDVPVTISAEPYLGYEFDHWEGDASGTSSSITVNLTKSSTIMAIFKESTAISRSIVINEINYKSSDDRDAGDWIELSNAADQAVDLSGWTITDMLPTNRFTMPEGTIINPNEFLVLTRDSADFVKIFSRAIPIVGDFSFGLSSTSDCVKLYDKEDILIDQVCYGTTVPWPITPNGQGATLALISKELNNEIASHWGADLQGSPNADNVIAENPDNIVLSSNTLAIPVSEPFPNPFAHKIMIKNHTGEPITLVIYDLKGNKMIDYSSNDREIDINTTSLSPGIYIMKVVYTGQTAEYRILKRE